MQEEKILLPLSFTYNLAKAHNMWVYSEDETKLKSFLFELLRNAKIESKNSSSEIIGLFQNDKETKKIIKDYSNYVTKASLEDGERKIRLLFIYTDYLSHDLLHLLQIGYALGFYIVLGTTKKINSSFRATFNAQINLNV